MADHLLEPPEGPPADAPEISGLVADSRNRATRNGTPSTRPLHEWLLAPGR